ncbi:hypothetical protein BC830DRAFT_913031 [Chytriomyces sp. MP71]|nr:hypothetical protein BC830DRAFT_913031 [Chytriomyces sp. MP71]
MPPYAASGSSGSVSGDVRVDQYNVFAAKAPLPSDIRSSTLTGTYSTGGDEKLSEKARMAAGENESSFLNNSFAGTGSVRSGPTNLDEKTFLRMNQQQQPPRPEAGPLPEKDTFAFQSGAAAAASAAASQPNRDPGALPEKDPLLLQLNNSNAGNYGSAAPRFGTAPQTAPGPLRFDDPTQWSVEQCEAWARKIASIGEMVALKIREHSITGHLLLKLTRDDMRSDFGLSVADRIILEREIQTLRTNAGLVDVLEEIDATVPPSYNF